MKIFNFNKRRAKKLFEHAQKLSKKGKHRTALEYYLKSIRLDPLRSESYFQVGSYYKSQKQWVQSLQYSQRAIELDPAHQAARWNAGIAATALQRWDLAWQTWNDCGYDTAQRVGPVELNLGLALARLIPEASSDVDPEVVWATRVDPVRGRIDSIPYPESGYHFGDVVLLDGAQTENSADDDTEFPILNVLQIFQPSDYQTAIAQIRITQNDDLKSLYRVFSSTPHELEDWTSNIHQLCQQCDSHPHLHSVCDKDSAWFAERTLGVAVYRKENVQNLFSQWQRQSNGVLIHLN